MKCKQCNNEMVDGMKFCPNCGTPQPNRCQNCGVELKNGEKYCYNCGTQVQTHTTTSVPTQIQMSGQTNSTLINPVVSMQTTNPIQTPSPAPAIASNKASTIVQNSFGSNDPYQSLPACQLQQVHPVSNSTLRLVWDNRYKPPFLNRLVRLLINQQPVAAFRTVGPNECIVNIMSSPVSIKIEGGIWPLNRAYFDIDLEANKDYVLDYYFIHGGSFAYDLKDNAGNILKTDGNLSMLWVLLSFFIPLIGIFLYFAWINAKPLVAKIGLIYGLAGAVVNVLGYFWFMNG